MKINQFFIFSISLLLFVGCKKPMEMDVVSVQQNESENSIKAMQWNLSGSNSSSLSTTIAALEITPEIVSTGMVIVYKRDRNGVYALPVVENINGEAYAWDYYIEQGEITVVRTGNISEQPEGVDFEYVVLSDSDVNKLIANGHTPETIFTLPRQQLLQSIP